MKKIVLMLLLLAFAAGLWWWLRPVGRSSTLATNAPTPADIGVAAPPAAVSVAPAPAGPGRYAPLDRLHDPAQPVQADLRILRDLFFHYQIAVKDPSGNPIGTNEEIVRVLQGRNRARLAFLPADDHPALDGQGRLCDRWGTPYFFHAWSGTRMEIRSAGPDRQLYTPDDAVTEEGGK